MAELDMERHLAHNHSELAAPPDVTHLLTQINQNFKQSKADQILRLLQDQDTLHVDKTDDDVRLIQEYEKIREEKVVCDSDTLTDTSDVSDIDENEIKQLAETQLVNTHGNTMNGHVNDTRDLGRESKTYRSSRSRTSMGFHKDDAVQADEPIVDTRDISIRPKSSYVRRHQLKKALESEGTMIVNGIDIVDAQPQRLSKSARPKSRLGRASVPRAERKITMVEAETVPTEVTAPAKVEESARAGANTNMCDRFASTRQPKRESKRAKAFCDLVANTQTQAVDNMSVDSSNNSMDTREEATITDVQPIMSVQSTFVADTEPEVKNPQFVRNLQYSSSFNHNSAPRNTPVQHPQQQLQQAPPQQFVPHKRPVAHTRQETHPAHPQASGIDPHLVRSETMTTNLLVRPDRREDGRLYAPKRTNSNLGYSRPKNPEPVQSRPIERPDLRPGTRTRRLQRRYMPQQAQSHMTNVRPTSESVILARQKTEKNLMKRQAENRPHSEKIIVNTQNKNMLSIAENPTQGPQTFMTSKGGVTQASHIQGGGFRGYDPGSTSRQKSSVNARDLPGDITLPRQGQKMMGARNPLTLMKLPPLEASLAAKKKERGLALAQRETCV